MKVQCGNIPDTLVPEVYIIMAIPLKCVAVLFGLSPEGKYNTVSYQSQQWVSAQPILLWINPAAKTTCYDITLETSGIQTVNPDVGR